MVKLERRFEGQNIECETDLQKESPLSWYILGLLGKVQELLVLGDLQ